MRGVRLADCFVIGGVCCSIAFGFAGSVLITIALVVLG